MQKMFFFKKKKEIHLVSRTQKSWNRLPPCGGAHLPVSFLQWKPEENSMIMNPYWRRCCENMKRVCRHRDGERAKESDHDGAHNFQSTETKRKHGDTKLKRAEK